MSSERRAAADDEETPVLSDWLAGNLRVSRSEPPGAAAATPSVHPRSEAVEASTRSEAAEASTAPDELASSSAEPPLESVDDETDEGETDEEQAEAALVPNSPDTAAEIPSTFAPQVMPADEAESDLVLFLAQERRARRTQRITVAAVVVALLLIGGGYLLSRRASDPAEPTETTTAAPPAAPPVTAKATAPAPEPNVDTLESEEELEPAAKIGVPWAIGAPAVPGSADPNAAAVPGGPSTARYPDLPRDVLIQLENAAETASPAAP